MPAPILSNPDLLFRLIAAQNHSANLSRDVMTFAGFCDDRAELERHVLNCEDSVATWTAARASNAKAV